MPRVLWAANSYWQTRLPVGANHFARELAERGWSVCFLSDPVTPLHALAARSRPDVWRRLGVAAGGPREVLRTDRGGRVTAWTPVALLGHANRPGLRRSSLLSSWTRWSVPAVRGVLSRAGWFDADLLVLDSPRYAWLLDAARPRVSVARVTDRLSGFAAATPAMIEAERRMVARADVALCTSLALLDEVRAWRVDGDVRHVGNGVHAARFRAPLGESVSFPGVDRGTAVYIGTIDAWFDQELVARAALMLPGVRFVIAGPAAVPTGRLQGISNVRLIGAVEPSRVPALLNACGVGIIPFRRDGLVESVCPLKLYEYLACGLPVVATRWRELELMASPAVLTDDAASFAEAVRAALATEPDRASLRAAGAAADWGVRLDALLSAAGLAHPQTVHSS